MTDKITSIPKWALIEVDSFHITLVQYSLVDEAGEDVNVYSAIFDTEILSDGKRHQNSISTHIHGSDAYNVALSALRVGLALTPQFADYISIIDEDGNKIDPELIDKNLTTKNLIEQLVFENTKQGDQILH